MRYTRPMTDSPALPDTPANERYVVSGARRLRCGFTTGTAAALASQAAAVLALTGRLPPEVRLLTPKGWPVAAVPVAGDRPDGQSCRPGSPGSVCAARCGIKKDAGDDPDVTDGCMVYATVTLTAGPDDGGPGAPAGQKQEEEPVLEHVGYDAEQCGRNK